MKKILAITSAILSPLALNAQSMNPGMTIEIFRTVAVIFVVGLFMVFILMILRWIIDFRLKNKIVEKGIPENLVSSILQANPQEDKNMNIKWFSILAGLGVGMLIIYYTQPLGIHSLAIMAFSLSLSFLGYYFFIRNSKK